MTTRSDNLLEAQNSSQKSASSGTISPSQTRSDVGDASIELVLLEPTIAQLNGHEVEYIVTLAQAARSRGVAFCAWVNRDIPPEASDVLRAEGVGFEHVFAPCVRPNLRLRVMRWLDEGARFWRALRATSPKPTNRRRVFCKIGSRPEYLLAASLDQFLSREASPLVMVFFDWDDSSLRTSTIPMKPLFDATLRLGKLAACGAKLGLAGQTAVVAEELAHVFDTHVEVFPMMVKWASFPQQCSQRRTRPRVGYVGALSPKRGAAQLPAAVEQLDAEVDWVFRVTLREGESGEEGRQVLAQLEALAQVDLRVGPFTREQYKKHLVEMDIVALPYLPQAFANKTSGICTEAIGLEKILVVPAGTWMARLVERHGIGAVYDEYTPRGLAAGLTKAVERRDEYERALAAFAPQWRTQNSASSFLDRLLGLAKELTAVRK